MTRVLSEGFEMKDLVGLSLYDCGISATARSGASSLFLSSGNSWLILPVSDLSELYFRTGYRYYSSSVNASYFSIEFRNGTTILCSVRCGMVVPNIKASLLVGSTTVDTGAMSLIQSTWYSLEVRIKIDDASGEFELKVDGTSECSFSGDTKPGADTVIDNIHIRLYRSDATISAYLDDIAINDTAGGVDDSWCGDGRIIVIKPNGDTATLDLTPSAAVDHYTLVDDIPADGDTTYVEGSVDDEEDIYDMEACGLSEVIINRIWTEARAKDTASSGKSIALITKASGGAEVSGGDVALVGSYTKKLLGAEQLVNPVDSAAWEVADIDALQGGPRTRP